MSDRAPFVQGSDTSQAAAESIAADAGQLREYVFSLIFESQAGGKTCDEIEAISNMRHQTASARVRELALANRIIDSGRRRATRSGRLAIVWVHAEDSTVKPEPTTQVAVNGSVLFTDPVGEDGLGGLRRRCLSCNRCVLSKTRNKVVFGEGNANKPPICFVGEAPGGTEDDVGRPFVGAAGKFLDKIFLAMKITRDEVYVCNAVACRPPDNRPPTKQEMDSCHEYLVGQIRAVRPKILVALGGSAVAAFFGGKPEITKMRGKWLEWEGIPVMPTFHPSYLKRMERAGGPLFVDAKKQVWSDMQQVLHKLGRLPSA